MSDGNFNRALLPHTPYASGLKVGRAQERMRAIEAFKEWLHAYAPHLDDEEVTLQCESFKQML